MKVLQINAVYGYSSTGTIVKHIQELSLKAGIDARVAYSSGHGEASSLTYEIGSKIDHKIHALLCRIDGKQAYFSKHATKKLLEYLDDFKPDVVHLHNLHSNYIHLNMLLDYLAKKDIATVITMHDCWYFTGGCYHYANVGCERWKNGCGKCPKQKQDTPAYLRDRSRHILKDRGKYINVIPRLTIVGCSDWISDECRKSIIGKNNIITIHNGFNLKIFKPVVSELREQLNIENKFVLLGPASKWLSEANKDTYQYFVENMDLDMTLVLFGHPNPDTSPLSEKVKYIGYVNTPEYMAAIYSIGDVFVNCSREDTLSSVNIEAQACGCPAIVYDATGNSETINPATGKIVPTGNYKDLLRAVKEIRKYIPLGIVESNREFINTRFNSTDNYRNYIEIYKNLCQKGY